MSHRPIEAKKRHMVAKAFRRTPPAYFDLVQWLVEHKHADTKRQAKEIILAERVKSGSHTLGVGPGDEVYRHVPVALRKDLRVAP